MAPRRLHLGAITTTLFSLRCRRQQAQMVSVSWSKSSLGCIKRSLPYNVFSANNFSPPRFYVGRLVLRLSFEYKFKNVACNLRSSNPIIQAEGLITVLWWSLTDLISFGKISWGHWLKGSSSGSKEHQRLRAATNQQKPADIRGKMDYYAAWSLFQNRL